MIEFITEAEYIQRLAVDVEHCISCHEDADHGYEDLIELYGNPPFESPRLAKDECVRVCCAVSNIAAEMEK